MNELVKVFQEVATADNIELLTTVMGLSGYSLRDIKGRKFLSYMKEKFSTKLPNGIETNLQSKILSDSLIVVSEYIKENPNLQEEILEAMGDMILNGVISENELTILYLEKLKKLNFFQLRLLQKFKEINVVISRGESSLLTYQINKIIDQIKNEEAFVKPPRDMISENSMELFKFNLLSEKGLVIGKKESQYGDKSINFLNSYGKGLLSFIIE